MKVIDLGPAKPDDPIYSSGLIAGGERLPRSRKNSPKKGNVVSPDVMNLKRVVKIVSTEMNAAMERLGSGKADNDQEPGQAD